MEPLYAAFRDRDVLVNVAITGLLLLLLLGLRSLVLSAVRRRELPFDRMRKWTAFTRNATFIAFLALVLPLWLEPLKSLAISLVAVAAAIVLATKELILCMTGALVRSTAKAFDVGDRIEVASVRGDVIDTNLFTTTILEIGPSHQQTGRAVVVPNALFVTGPLVNETYTEAFVLHTLSVPVKLEPGWERAEEALRRAVEEECVEWLDEAKRHFDRVSKERGFEPPVVDARVTLQVTKPDEITLLARLPVPARRKGKVEQEILRRWLVDRTGEPARA